MTRTPTPTLLIRPILPADRQAVLSLWSRCWLDAHGALAPVSVTGSRNPAYFDKFFDPYVADMRGAFDGGEIVAFGMLSGDEIDQIHVAPAHRGTGLAARFLASLEDELAAAGHRLVRLFCAVGNERAHRFYLRQGYRIVGVEENDVWVPEGAAPVRLSLDIFEKRLLAAATRDDRQPAHPLTQASG